MTWTVIARQEWRLTRGARSVKVLLGLLVCGILLAAYVYPVVGADPITTARFAGFASGVLTTLVPLVGVLLGYNAIASERESGALVLSLSLPCGRDDLVVGKFVGRTGVLSVSIVAAMVGAGVLVVYPFGELQLLRFLAFVLLTVGFGVIWTGLGIAVSVAATTRRWALVGGVGLLFVFVVALDTVASALNAALNATGVSAGELPDVLQFLFALEPGQVFERLVAGFVDPSGTVGSAWYLDEWIALVAFLCWIVGPVGLAYRRFERSDIA